MTDEEQAALEARVTYWYITRAYSWNPWRASDLVMVGPWGAAVSSDTENPGTV